LKIEFLISKRIANTKNTENQYSKIISKLSIIAIASSLSIIIIAICCGEGLKKNIENNFIEIFSNIRIENYTNNNEVFIEGNTFSLKKEKLRKIKELKDVNHIQSVVSKFAALSNEKNLKGSILIGVDSTYNWQTINKKIIEGNTNSLLKWKKGDSPHIVISENMSKKLDVNVNDTILASFSRIKKNKEKIDTTATFSNIIISGIYKTDIKEYDEKICLINANFIRNKFRINNDAVNFYEIFIAENANSNSLAQEINKIIEDPFIKAEPINKKFDWLFQWINMFNKNIIYITIIMLIICIVNMLSFLIVFTLERSRMIGILKSFGAKNLQIGKIFLYRSINITLKGMLLGNIIGLTICYIQKKIEIIKLNPDSYFVNQIPISFPWENIIQVNILSLILIQLAIIIPYYKITTLKPAKILKIK